MATEDNGERRVLQQSLRSQMGYGTAAFSAKANQSSSKTRQLICRKLLGTDTLMGITLKYGVTVSGLIVVLVRIIVMGEFHYRSVTMRKWL